MASPTAATVLQTYTPVFVAVGGNLFYEEVSTTLTRVNNAQRVITVLKGFAGLSVGAPICDFTMDCAIPLLTGPEVPASGPLDQACALLNPVSFIFYIGPQTCSFEGYIESIEISHAANAVSKLIYKGVGTYATLS